VDRQTFIHRRKGRYMAQILESFEELIEPHLPVSAAGDIQAHKGLVRMRMDALAHDAADLLSLDGGAINGVAQEMRDRLSPTGRP
jgi:hypothetical protein